MKTLIQSKIHFITIIISAANISSRLAWGLYLRRRTRVIPPPDGGYPNLNTAEGDFALFT